MAIPVSFLFSDPFKMTDHQIHSGTKAGTAGGTLLAVLTNIDPSDLVRTCILAAIGASVSFGMSLFWKWVVRKFRNSSK